MPKTQHYSVTPIDNLQQRLAVLQNRITETETPEPFLQPLLALTKIGNLEGLQNIEAVELEQIKSVLCDLKGKFRDALFIETFLKTISYQLKYNLYDVKFEEIVKDLNVLINNGELRAVVLLMKLFNFE